MREKKRKRKTLVQATETEVLKQMDVSKLNEEKRKRKRATAARKAGISRKTYSRRTNNMKKEKRKELFLIMLLHIWPIAVALCSRSPNWLPHPPHFHLHRHKVSSTRKVSNQHPQSITRSSGTNLSRRGMQHANILPRHNVDEFTCLNVPDLHEIGLKCKNIRIRKCKRIGIALPRDLPIRSSTPTVAVDEKGEIAII